LVRSASLALTGGTPVTDMTLTGTATWKLGYGAETGSAKLVVIPGASRIDVFLPSGTKTEITNDLTDPSGVWVGPDGKSHAQAMHNCLTDTGWFAPGVSYLTASTGVGISYVGSESFAGATMQHISAWRTIPIKNPRGATRIRHLSQVEFYLDANTGLPIATRFNIHPDDNDRQDIPVEVWYSDYRAVSGVQVPFRVRKYVNNSLVLDIVVQAASLNSGVPESAFSVQ
jgi:hypothetical protein